MRLFIAINFNEDIKNRLEKDIETLKQQSVAGKFITKDNLHLTAVFLGEVEKNKIAEIPICMRIACEGLKPSKITVTGFGKFIRNGEVLYWRGMECSDDILTMRSKLIKELKVRGFKVDQKPFKPHITMVRRCIMSKTFSQQEYENSLEIMDMLVDNVCLMKSERINGQMVYTKIAEETIK